MRFSPACAFLIILAAVSACAFAGDDLATMQFVAAHNGQAARRLSRVEYDYVFESDGTLGLGTDEAERWQKKINGHMVRDGVRWFVDQTIVTTHTAAHASATTTTDHVRAFFSDKESGFWFVGTGNPNIYQHENPTQLSDQESRWLKDFLWPDRFLQPFTLADLPFQTIFPPGGAPPASQQWKIEKSLDASHHTIFALSGWHRKVAGKPRVAARIDADQGFLIANIIYRTINEVPVRLITVTPGQVGDPSVWYAKKVVDVQTTGTVENPPFTTEEFRVTRINASPELADDQFTEKALQIPKYIKVLRIGATGEPVDVGK